MLLLKNGTVMTMGPVGILNQTDILVDNKKIVRIERNIPVPNECNVIDVTGYYVLPGFVDAHSHVGGMNIAPAYTDDINELTSPMHPELNSYYGIDPECSLFQNILEDGITSSCIVPGSGNVVCGWGIVFKSAGKSFDDRVIKNPAVLKAAVGLNPKSIYAGKMMAPMTRMSIANMLISYFANVKRYMEQKNEAVLKGTKLPVYDEGLEHGIPVLEKKIPLKVHAYQHDMMTVLEIAKKFDFNITLDHAQGASDFLDELEDPHVKGIIYGPVVMGLGPGEICKADYEALYELDQRGILTAMDTDGPVVTGQTLLYQVGEAVRMGMDPIRALAMITINAAKILQCEERIGSLEIEKDADILVFNGIPGKDVTAENIMTIIDGEIVYQKASRKEGE